MDVITIVGDSLSMDRPLEGIQYKDTYVFKLQLLLGSGYHVVNYSERTNTVLKESTKISYSQGMLFSDPKLIIFHLGIVDCAPRIFGPREYSILELFSSLSVVFRKPIGLYILTKSKFRRFFTKYFPKTYVSNEMFKKTMNLLIQEIKKNTNAKVFIINIADTNKKNKFRSYNFQKNIYTYNEILESLVNENRDLCTLINIFELSKNNQEKFLLDDGIHLSPYAHDAISKLLFQKIKEDLNKEFR